MAYLPENTPAPEFTLQDEEGREVSLSALQGRRVVLYFYPRDNTPGCTAQACSFAALKDDFAAHNAVVVGVSADSQESHQKFKAKQQLNFTLLSDPEHQVLEQYGAWQQKNLYGRVSLGTVRSTYIIDEHGVIVKVFKRARAKTNAEDCLKIIKALDGAAD